MYLWYILRTMSHLRTLREKAGLTRQELARAIGVAEVTIKKWEEGTRVPRRKRLKALADALRCTQRALRVNGEARS